MSTKQRTTVLVAQIGAGIAGLGELMADPGTAACEEVADSFEELERVLNTKAPIDAAFAWLADASPAAGRRAGSSRGFDYLLQNLGLSKREAAARLHTGHNLFSRPEPPPPPEPAPGGDGGGAPGPGTGGTGAPGEGATEAEGGPPPGRGAVRRDAAHHRPGTRAPQRTRRPRSRRTVQPRPDPGTAPPPRGPAGLAA